MKYKTSGKKNKDSIREDVCQGCKGLFDDDDYQKSWIGCDKADCGRWFHFWCAGFVSMPDTTDPFVYIYAV